MHTHTYRHTEKHTHTHAHTDTHRKTHRRVHRYGTALTNRGQRTNEDQWCRFGLRASQPTEGHQNEAAE
jgi:hypothetical protein